MPKLLRLFLSLFVVVSMGAALAACGDDDDDDAADTEETTTTADEGDEATDEGEEGEEDNTNPCFGGATLPEEEGGTEPPADATPVELGVVEDGETYGYTGGDELGTPGSYAVTLNNNGEEAHMALITRLAPSETRTIEELLNLPPEEQENIASTDLADVFACPGQTSDVAGVEVSEPGRYVVLCFIPAGSTVDVAEFPEGPPHALTGMYKEFTVS